MIAAFIAQIETSFTGLTCNAIITIQSPLFLRGKYFYIKPTQLGECYNFYFSTPGGKCSHTSLCDIFFPTFKLFWYVRLQNVVLKWIAYVVTQNMSNDCTVGISTT